MIKFSVSLCEQDMLTYNIELLTKNQEDHNKIISVLEGNMYVWNELSKVLFEIVKGKNRKILHDKTYFKIREERPEIPAQVIIRAENDVIATYRSIRSNGHNISKPALKTNLSMRLDKRLYRMTKESVFITTLEERVELKLKFYPKVNELFQKYEIGDPLIFVRNNRIFLSVPFKNNEFVSSNSDDLCVGVDLGMKNIAATSEGIIYTAKDFLARRRKTRYLKRQLKKKGTKSALRHWKKLDHKELNQSDDFSQKLANSIIKDTNAKVIVLEDLKHIKKKTCKKKNKKIKSPKTLKSFNSRWSQIPVRKIQTTIEYKATLYKKRVCYVNPANTSKINSLTNEKDGVRNKGRYECKDGKLLHSDVNASINIANRSKLPLSGDNATRQKALFGQAVVNRPIVC